MFPLSINPSEFLNVTHVLFSSSAFPSSLLPLGMSHFATETGNIVVTLLGVPFLSTLFASKAKLLVLVFSFSTGAVKILKKERFW